MNSQKILSIARRWRHEIPRTSSATHYEGCESEHWGCATMRMTDEIERLRAALKSIADSACCGKCQEAAWWAKETLCHPFNDPSAHDFQGWVEVDGGRGSTRVCTQCGITAVAHSLKYGP